MFMGNREPLDISLFPFVMTKTDSIVARGPEVESWCLPEGFLGDRSPLPKVEGICVRCVFFFQLVESSP